MLIFFPVSIQNSGRFEGTFLPNEEFFPASVVGQYEFTTGQPIGWSEVVRRDRHRFPDPEQAPVWNTFQYLCRDDFPLRI